MTWAFLRCRLPVNAVLVAFAGLGVGELAQRRQDAEKAGLRAEIFLRGSPSWTFVPFVLLVV
jgi:hypothetical protein